jgi:hypothetical protein
VALMPVTGPGDATGNNLAALRQIIPEQGNVLVIDVSHFIRAESAELPTLKKSLAFQTFLLYVATENFPLSLTHEIFDPTRAWSLEWSNSAFGLRQVPIRPFGDASFAKMGAQKFRNACSRDIFSANYLLERHIVVCGF